jgi:CHAT domain-containing protein/tetratricopeptide (TPR) repeat protein
MKKFFCCIFIVLFCCGSMSVVAQDGQKEKAAAGKAAFDEAIKLRQEGRFASYKAALEKFELSVRLYTEAGDEANAASSLLGVGLMKSLLYERDAALEAYLKALEVFRKIGHVTLQARTLNNLGRLYDEIGDQKKALEYHLAALPLRKQENDKSGEAQTLNSLGAVYMSIGERVKAFESFNSALKLRRETGEKREEAIILNNLGRLFTDLGETAKAITYLEQSLSLRQAVNDKLGEAVCLNNLGMVYSDAGDNQKAISVFERALSIFTELGFETQKAAVYNNLGRIHLELKDLPKSLELSRRAIPLYQKAENKSGEATALNNIGFALTQQGEAGAASVTFSEALLLAKLSGARELEAIVLGNLMRNAKDLRNPALAVFYGKQCINRFQELRAAIGALEPNVQRTYLRQIGDHYRFLADLLIESGQFSKAEEVLQMLKEEEFSGFVKRDATEIRNLRQRIDLTEQERRMLDRYAEFAEKVVEIGRQFQELDEKRRSLRRREQDLTPAESAKLQEFSSKLSDANAAFRLFLEKDLSKELGRETVKRIEIDRNLQDKLRKWGEGTVALTTVVTENRFRIILTTPTIQVDGKYEVSAEELNRKIFQFRAALQNPRVDPRPAGLELYNIIIKPIEKELAAAKAKTLVWSLDGSLRYVPVAALSPDGISYLVEKFQNVTLTSKTRDDLTDSNARWQTLGMGVTKEQTVTAPNEPGQLIKFPALPAIEDELMAIIRDETKPREKGILPGKRFLDEEFTRRNLIDSLASESADGERRFKVVHLASHFRLGKNWSESFLLMGNGQVLTLEEISNSPEISFGDIELVTLSACNTGFGEETNGGEVDSLAEVIQTKSGKAVLASLWEVVDKSTSMLMSEFYRLRKQNPTMTKADAMQRAQLMLLRGGAPQQRNDLRSATRKPTDDFQFDERRPFAHPMYWSPFVLIGNWR